MAYKNSLADIPIRVVSVQTDTLALAKTLLHELHALLKTLLETGQNGALDLRALPPLGKEGYKFLKDQLGVGEVNACIQSFGRSEIQETAFSGIWWVTHYNQEEGLLTELIEVNFLPEILKTPKEDVLLAEIGLSKLLSELT